MFHIGDKVVHPMHGAGIVESIVQKKVNGVTRDYYILKLPVRAMVVMVPVEHCEEIGVRPIVDRALADFDRMRTREGERLKEDILARAAAIEEKVALVEERSPQTVAEYRAKLEARMQEVLSNTQIDPARILTEAAIFADKVAVDEETVRLRSHIGQLRAMLDQGGATGRKLDFLIQEFNREANTIGSKCSDLEIARHVVDIKAEIEKIREQVQNIE